MHKKSLFRAPLLALVGLLAVLILPAAAQAHTVTFVASCDDSANVTVRWTVTFTNFGSSHPTLKGTVSLDGNVVQTARGQGAIATSTLTGSAGGRGEPDASSSRLEFSWVQSGEHKTY